MTRDLAAFCDYLKTHGLKLTASRRLVVEKLAGTHGHISADDLLDLLRRDKTPVSKATVYRTLSILEESGLFDGHDFGSGRKLYEPVVGRAHHDHLYCINCGRVIEFEEPRIERLQQEVVTHHQFTPVYHSHKIFGYCADCRDKTAPQKGGDHV
ncbi:MAG: transcriptional repressor [Planctomycetes bacterium]|nr:transcriptional repressor [Planctomycetota bacterium]